MIHFQHQSVAKRRVQSVCTKGLRSISLACAAMRSSHGSAKRQQGKTPPLVLATMSPRSPAIGLLTRECPIPARMRRTVLQRAAWDGNARAWPLAALEETEGLAADIQT